MEDMCLGVVIRSTPVEPTSKWNASLLHPMLPHKSRFGAGKQVDTALLVLGYLGEA